jgi:hypothetical protein
MTKWQKFVAEQPERDSLRLQISPYQSPFERPARLHNTSSDDERISSVEMEIKSRNEQAYRNLRCGAPAVPKFDNGKNATAASPAQPTSHEHTQAEKPPGKVVLSTVPSSQLGLKILHQRTGNTCVDIVAVHGLGAIPEITWKDSKSSVNWLSDSTMLPKVVPEARIMRFGYDSLWLGKEPIRTKLSTIANKLLLVLGRERAVSCP